MTGDLDGLPLADQKAAAARAGMSVGLDGSVTQPPRYPARVMRWLIAIRHALITVLIIAGGVLAERGVPGWVVAPAEMTALIVNTAAGRRAVRRVR